MSTGCGITIAPAKTATDGLRHVIGIGLLAMLALASGCAIGQPVEREVAQAVESWQRPGTQLGVAEETPFKGDGDTSDAPQGPGKPGELLSPLPAYIQEALERNPSVKAAAAGARAKLERVAQVLSLPDPILRAVVRPEPIQTAAGDIHFTLGLAQKIPLPARLDRAGRMAAAEARMAIERLNVVRLDVIAEVERAYYVLYLVDRSRELTEDRRQSLEDLEQVLVALYRVGKTGQQDLLRLQTEIEKLRDEESRLQRRRSSAAAALNRLLDYPPARELPVTQPITPQAFDGDVEQLIAQASEHNPELAILTHQVQRDSAALELAELGYWPDPTIGFEWTYVKPRDAFEPPNAQPRAVNRMSETGADSWALMLQFNMPIWFDRLEAAKREARLRLRETRHKRQALSNTVAFRIFDAWTRVRTGQDTIKLLESTLIPQARQTYDVSLTVYQAGRSDFLTVIDNWGRLLDFELMFHREVTDLKTAFSELQRDVGLQLMPEEVVPETQDRGEQR